MVDQVFFARLSPSLVSGTVFRHGFGGRSARKVFHFGSTENGNPEKRVKLPYMKHHTQTDSDRGTVTIRQAEDGILELVFQGQWTATASRPAPEEVCRQLQQEGSGDTVRVLAEPAAADMALPTFLFILHGLCAKENIDLDTTRLPAGAKKLLQLATAVPEREGARRQEKRQSLVARIGEGAITQWGGWLDSLTFIGEVCLSLGRLVTGRATLRWSDVFVAIQQCGPSALPIVTLIGFLMGLILAFVGAIQLHAFGADIYVADLVGIGIVRELGAIMAGVVMAGRTGASFAAELGTMEVNEETDALKTLGISPVDFLVLPRILALTVMMPLLCIYADFVGLLGGMVVGVLMLGVDARLYLNETMHAVGMNDFWIGVFMSLVFGILVSMAGCLRGSRCGRSASSVGIATTSAVVTSIVSIVVATSIITVLCSVLGL